jgi:hypothetical protein
MTLQGELRTMELPDLLQWLAASQSTGTVLFRHRAGDITWKVAAGHLVDVVGSGFETWASQRVGREAWEKARNWSERERTAPAVILQRVGLIAAADLAEWRTLSIKRSLHTILMREDGWFRFTPGPVQGEGIPIESLLMEVAVELDDQMRVRQRFGRGLVWVEAIPGAPLDDMPDDLARLVRSGVHVLELGWLLPGDPWPALQALDAAATAGTVALLPVDPALPDDPVQAWQDALIAQRSFQVERAATLFEDALAAAWDDTTAEEATSRWLERYDEMVRTRLFRGDRLVAPTAAVGPLPGDPWGAWLLRVLDAPATVDDLRRRAPFHPFFITRAVRRLVEAGRLELEPIPADGGTLA